jgi:hypothetical protein
MGEVLRGATGQHIAITVKEYDNSCLPDGDPARNATAKTEGDQPQ